MIAGGDFIHLRWIDSKVYYRADRINTMAYERHRPLYRPGQTKPYKISRSKIDLFVQCPRCFWLDGRLGIKRPSMPAFTLNSAVDTLLKSEFDEHRAAGSKHPLQTAYGLDCRPVPHDKLKVWRENFEGVEAVHKLTNMLVTGAIDDLWITDDGNYVVVDYKATSRNGKIEELGDSRWNDQYRRQLEVYQWLLRQNGLPVSDTAFWVYANGIKDKKAFDGKLEFDVTIVKHIGKDDWVEPTLVKIKKCLESDEIPEPAADCEHCAYARSRTELTLKALQNRK
jgi:CRISPR/Cas system-associated exonuclease Cas4 (RecB family)